MMYATVMMDDDPDEMRYDGAVWTVGDEFARADDDCGMHDSS